MRRGQTASKLAAAQACSALVKYLEALTPGQIAVMRSRMRKRRMRPEESRDWGASRDEVRTPKGGVIRTRTGCVYR